MASVILLNKLISRSEDIAEKVYRWTSVYLPLVTRLCLLSTFVDDGIHIFRFWEGYIYHTQSHWGLGDSLTKTIISILFITRIVASFMIAIQNKVPHACGIFFALIITELVVYDMLKIAYINELYRTLALIGALSLLLAENQTKGHDFLNVPSKDRRNNYLLLCGRGFLLFNFFTFTTIDLALLQILHNILIGVLLVLVLIGYKTKLSALILIVYLTFFNIYKNIWWLESNDDPVTKRYIFFHTLTVIGGLLSVIIHGPGGISLDGKKNV